jgi:hypothetical protein
MTSATWFRPIGASRLLYFRNIDMQAAVQTNNPLFSYQSSFETNLFGANRASSQMPMQMQSPMQMQRQAPMPMQRGGGFGGGGGGGGGNLASQITNMMSGFSQASFSIGGQTMKNGETSSFFAQGEMSNRGQSAKQQPARSSDNYDRRGHGNASASSRSDNRYDNRADNRNDKRADNRNDNTCDNRSRGNDRTPSRNDCECKGSSKNSGKDSGKDCGRTDDTKWTDTGVSGNKASIDLGDYKLDFNKADSSMIMTNAQTGDKTKIWGDPHLTLNENSAKSTTGMFKGPMSFVMPDNTKVTVGTQPAANNKSITFSDQVTITRGDQAYQVKGLSEQNKTGLSVEKSRDGNALDAAAPDGYTLEASRDGKGWIDPKTGKAPTAADIAKA